MMTPKFLRFLYQLWMGFAHRVARVNSLVILGLLYAVVITPMSLILRARGVDLLRLDPRLPSLRVDTRHRDPLRTLRSPY
jgi:hypothetical protein